MFGYGKISSQSNEETLPLIDPRNGSEAKKLRDHGKPERKAIHIYKNGEDNKEPM